MGQITGDWQAALKNEFHQPYYAKLYKTIMEEYRTRKVFPPPQDMFNAFEYTPLNDVKVVILGQDPYHNDGQANGLCFSVREDIDIPPSLVNIYKELHSDLGCYIPDNGCLEKWAKQAEALGAGEILLTSMDCDGTKAGYDIPLTRAVSDAVSIPVIASGGAGTLEHFYEGLTDGGADAVLAASLFHYKELEISQVKDYLAEKGVPVRR